MSEQGKARHFKLTVDYDGFLPKLFFNNFVVPSNFKNREQLTVIEYSAFEQLQKENEALKAKLEKCKEALEFYASKGIWGSGYSNDYGSNPMMLNVNDHDYEVIVDNDELIGGKLARQTLKEIEDMK